MTMTGANPVEPFDHRAEPVDSADRWRAAARTAIPRITYLHAERLAEDTLEYGAGIPSGYVAVLDDPAPRRR